VYPWSLYKLLTLALLGACLGASLQTARLMGNRDSGKPPQTETKVVHIARSDFVDLSQRPAELAVVLGISSQDTLVSVDSRPLGLPALDALPGLGHLRGSLIDLEVRRPDRRVRVLILLQDPPGVGPGGCTSPS
jgi:hypothetical protein